MRGASPVVTQLGNRLAEAWPDPNPDGSTTFPEDVVRLWRAYLKARNAHDAVERARCKVPDDGSSSPSAMRFR